MIISGLLHFFSLACFTDDKGGRSLERQRTFSQSPPIPILSVLKGTKNFSQTLENLDKPATKLSKFRCCCSLHRGNVGDEF